MYAYLLVELAHMTVALQQITDAEHLNGAIASADEQRVLVLAGHVEHIECSDRTLVVGAVDERKLGNCK